MPAEAICPHCQLKLRVPADYGGRSVKCAQCQQRFIVTILGEIAPPALVPASRTREKAPATFEKLVLSVLDEDEESSDDLADAHIERVAGPSHFWRCAKCQATWPKRKLPAAQLQSLHLTPQVRCETCGAAYSYHEVHAGKFDAPEIALDCPHCHKHLNGPADNLLGRPCPACGHALPTH